MSRFRLPDWLILRELPRPELRLPSLRGPALRGPRLRLPAVLRGSGGVTVSGPRVPTFLADIYWDLRDRHLLALVALAIVAIAAVPFLLGGGSEEQPAVTAGAASGAAELAVQEGEQSTLQVVEAHPGLREYSKRLANRTPHNPFQPKGGPPSLAGAKLNQPPGAESPSAETSAAGGGASGSSTGSAGESVSAPSSHAASSPSSAAASPPSPPASSPPVRSHGGGGGSTGGPAGAPTQGGAPTTHVTFFTAAIDVRISRSGGRSDSSREANGDAKIMRKVLPLTPLPGSKEPVVTFMGLSHKGKPLLLVSTHVLSLFGEAKCASGDQICQLLEVEPGFPVTFVYGLNEVHWHVKVLKVEPVVTGHS